MKMWKMWNPKPVNININSFFCQLLTKRIGVRVRPHLHAPCLLLLSALNHPILWVHTSDFTAIFVVSCFHLSPLFSHCCFCFSVHVCHLVIISSFGDVLLSPFSYLGVSHFVYYFDPDSTVIRCTDGLARPPEDASFQHWWSLYFSSSTTSWMTFSIF